MAYSQGGRGRKIQIEESHNRFSFQGKPVGSFGRTAVQVSNGEAGENLL
jgi:hypothetical protein